MQLFAAARPLKYCLTSGLGLWWSKQRPLVCVSAGHVEWRQLAIRAQCVLAVDHRRAARSPLGRRLGRGRRAAARRARRRRQRVARGPGPPAATAARSACAAAAAVAALARAHRRRRLRALALVDRERYPFRGDEIARRARGASGCRCAARAASSSAAPADERLDGRGVPPRRDARRGRAVVRGRVDAPRSSWQRTTLARPRAPRVQRRHARAVRPVDSRATAAPLRARRRAAARPVRARASCSRRRGPRAPPPRTASRTRGRARQASRPGSRAAARSDRGLARRRGAASRRRVARRGRRRGLQEAHVVRVPLPRRRVEGRLVRAEPEAALRELGGTPLRGRRGRAGAASSRHADERGGTFDENWI